MLLKEEQFLKLQKSTSFLYILDIFDSGGCFSFISRSSAGIVRRGYLSPHFSNKPLPNQSMNTATSRRFLGISFSYC